MKWNREMIVKCPCKECDERVLGCHGSCERYRKYQKDIKKVHEKEKHYRRRTW